jgi:hypothetical protein
VRDVGVVVPEPGGTHRGDCSVVDGGSPWAVLGGPFSVGPVLRSPCFTENGPRRTVHGYATSIARSAF